MDTSNIIRNIMREGSDINETSTNRPIFNINYFNNFYYNDNRNSENRENNVTNRRNTNPVSGRVISTTIPIVTSNIRTTRTNSRENNSDSQIIDNTTTNIIEEALRNVIDNEINNFSNDEEESTNEGGALNLTVLNEATEIFINDNSSEICAICNENFVINTICRRNSKCGHYFHQRCIDIWYSENNKCPQCNQIIE